MALIRSCATYCSGVIPCFAASAVSCSRCCLAKSSGVMPRLAASVAMACCICCIAATCCGDGWGGAAILADLIDLRVEGGRW